MGCLGIAAIIALVGVGGYEGIKCYKAQDKRVAGTEQGILNETGLLGPHALILLNQVPGFTDVPGYFKYINMYDKIELKEVPGVEYACKIGDNVQVLQAPLDKTKAVISNQASQVNMEIDPEQLIKRYWFILRPAKYKKLDDIVLRSTSVNFSLSNSDYANFKGPK